MAWACAHSPTPQSSTTATGVATDTIWYVSARARDGGIVTTRLADSLEYGFVVADHRPGGELVTEDLKLTIRDSTRLDRQEFTDALRARATDGTGADTNVVLYIHGYGTWQHEALRHAASAAARSQSRIPWVVFSWPSKGSGMASPTTRAILTSGYWNDSIAAAASKPAFGRAMETMLGAVGGRHLLLVAHSMGAQLTSDALHADTVLRARLTAERLRALAYFAPDLDAERFRAVIVPSMRPLTRRVVLYASGKDRTLRISQSINKSERAGLLGAEAIGPYDRSLFETVDITDGWSAEGMWQRLFGSHHSLSRASAALFDLMHIVAREYPPSCRSTLGTAILNDAGDWRLTESAPPSPSALSACER
jgi:esterase/lipase superfamily enzyme